MRIRIPGAAALVILMLLGGLSPPTRAAAGVRELPSGPEQQSAAGVDYALRSVPFGGITATLIDVHAGGGDWTRVDAAHLPALPSGTPPAKESVQWFYGSIAGWMAVPDGWRLQLAAIGVDGNARYSFVAPEGAAGGWVSYAVILACEACVLQEAEGLLPDAGEQLGRRHDATPIYLGQTNPVMSWQSRPDDCTALFRYRSGGLTVHAAVLSSVAIASLDSGKGELSLAQAYAGLPASRGALAEFLLGGFQQAFPACRSPNGWPG